MNAIIENFKDIITNKYAQFKGRANRAEFWQYVLVYFVIAVAFIVLMNLFAGVKVLRMVFMILYVIIMLALLLPTVSLISAKSASFNLLMLLKVESNFFLVTAPIPLIESSSDDI